MDKLMIKIIILSEFTVRSRFVHGLFTSAMHNGSVAQRQKARLIMELKDLFQIANLAGATVSLSQVKTDGYSWSCYLHEYV